MGIKQPILTAYMTYLQKINLNISFQKEKLILFLAQNGLIFDSLESAYCIFNEAEEIIASGGREKNILKCFAVNPVYKGLGLTGEIISALLKEGYKAGYKSFFIFTKKKTIDFFIEANFSVLQTTDDSALLYRGEKSVEESLKEKVKTYYPDFIFPQNGNDTVVCSNHKNAAIVMNANPFTLGHRYLTEKAYEFCGTEKKLFVFVVETDNSFFSFKERFALVQENVKDLNNVFVLPSSEFLISAATFPSYFLKEKTLVQKNQTQLDARMFLKYFVPLFNIGVRFLGEEPLDKNTELYNETLQNELPPACSVKIIPRKKIITENSEMFISATAVREAYKNGNLEKVKNYIPAATYTFLAER